MDFNEFQNYVAEQLPGYLPASWSSAELHINKVQKIGAEYTALSVFREGVPHSVSIDLDDYYRSYCGGMREEEMFRQIADSLVDHEGEAPDIRWLSAYGQVKDRLFVRVCSREMNAAYLRTAPHRCIEDLALTCHVLVDLPERSDVFASVTVRHDLLAGYGAAEETLFADALASSAVILPARISRLREALGAELTCAVNREPFLVVTNSRGINGASALFYPGMMEKIARESGGSYYVLPSSIHEVLIVKDEGEDISGALEELVRDVNRRVVDPSERLSDHVYHYDARTAVFRQC